MSEMPAHHGRWVDKEIFTTGEAAEVCGVSQQTIIRCFDAGRVAGYRVPGSRFRRIPRNALLAFMRANGIDPSPLLGRRSLVLLVTADADLARRIATRLSDLETVDVVIAATAFEAGLRVASAPPAAAVIDAAVPGLVPGLDIGSVVRELRERSGRRIRLVVLTEVESHSRPHPARPDAVVARTNIEAVATRLAELLTADPR